MTRLMVCGAELVCSVPKQRWPVSAVVSAASMVSRSRISPTSTTSGSWRSTERSAFLNECVSVPISRWLTTQLLCWCRNSIGSSSVMMCSWRSVLILSIIAASVVDLPEPVGPVTSTRPRGLLHSSSITGGRPSSSNVRILNGMVRKTAPTAPFCMKTLARKRHRFFTPNDRSSSCSSSNFDFCASVRIE